MNAKYLSQQKRWKQFIGEWVNNSILNKSWEVYQDLHIDEIDVEFQQQQNWIEGSLFIYEIILDVINTNLYNCVVVIPLSYSDKQTDSTKLTWDEIKKGLDLTPPSFYLFPIGEENYEKTINSLLLIDTLSKDTPYKILFQQEQESESEYSRSIYIIRN